MGLPHNTGTVVVIGGLSWGPRILGNYQVLPLCCMRDLDGEAQGRAKFHWKVDLDGSLHDKFLGYDV